MGIHVAAGINGIAAGIVVGVIMHVVAAAVAGARLHIPPDAMALSKHHRCRPEFDPDADGLPGLKIKPAQLTMIGSIRPAKVGVEFTIQYPQPAFATRQ